MLLAARRRAFAPTARTRSLRQRHTRLRFEALERRVLLDASAMLAEGEPDVSCVTPDNGSGTADLPPVDCLYANAPGEVWQVIDGLPPGTTMIGPGTLSNWQQVVVTPGGTLGGDVEQFDATFDLRLIGTGDLQGFHRRLTLPLAIETHSGPRNPGDPEQSFDTTMFRLQGQMVGDPDFDVLSVTAGVDFGLPSPGHTTLTELPSGDFAVDSFFDVTYQIDFVGAPGSALDGLAGTTTDTIRIEAQQDAPVAVFDAVPNPAACHQEITFGAGGSYHNNLGREIVEYRWDFGDDTPPVDTPIPVVAHTYDQFGEYEVTLTVVDNSPSPRADHTSQTIEVSLGNHPPVADPNGPYTLEVGQLLTLDASGSYDPDSDCGDRIVEYAWDLNDDTFFDVFGPDPVMAIPWESLEGILVPGVNPITLRVTDSLGEVDHAASSVELIDQPPLCVVPDNGTGTADLPLDGCVYVGGPGEIWQIIDGLPPDTTIDIPATLGDWENIVVTFPGPGGVLGGEIEQFDATLTMLLNGTGDLAGFHRHLDVPLAVETHTGPRNPGDPLQAFVRQVFSLQGEIFGDPDFDELRVTVGSMHGLPSPGQTTLTQLPGGDFAVDSFFDITYQIDFVGAPGSALAGLAGSTTSTIRVVATQDMSSVPVALFDANPNPAACQEAITFDASGSFHTDPARSIVEYRWDFGDGSPVVPAPVPEIDHVYDQFGWYEVTLTVVDDNSPPRTSQTSTWVEVVLFNNPPVADPNGPYVLEAGQPLTLDGSGSTDPDETCGDEIVIFEWDLDYDGEFDGPYDIATDQPIIEIPWIELEPLLTPGINPISLRVTDMLGEVDQADTSVTLVEPTVGACITPDNGTGTADLPPIACLYANDSLEEWLIVDGLPPGSTLVGPGTISDWRQVSVLPGGSLGGEVEQFNATFDLRLAGTGSMAGFERQLALPLSIETHSGPRNPGDPVQPFDTEMVSLQGQMVGDPDFDTLSVTAGTAHGLAGPGHTTLTQLPSGDFAVDSFFDITYRIDFVGAPGSALDGLAGSTTATLRLVIQQDGPVAVFDAIPEFVACHEDVTFDASGSHHNNLGHDIVTYRWDFGDETLPVETPIPMVTHAYDAFGEYEVTLTVVDDHLPPRTDETSRIVSVSLGNRPPVADADGPYVTQRGQPLTLDGSGSSDPDEGCGDRIVEYAWDLDNNGFFDVFGPDPVMVIPWEPLETILVPGDNPVTLRVTDGFGEVDFATTTVTLLEAEILGRMIFYNNSAFDGFDPAAGPSDEAAIAWDKVVLEPEQTATADNYTSFSGGINGIMIDVIGMPEAPTLGHQDLSFFMGNSDDIWSWQHAPDPSSITVTPVLGAEGVQRITLIWPDGTITGKWLEVGVRPGENIPIAQVDYFYVGNAIGETLNDPHQALVTAADVIAARDHLRGDANRADIFNVHDFNRDQRVNATDQVLARNHATSPFSALRLITPPLLIPTPPAEGAPDVLPPDAQRSTAGSLTQSSRRAEATVVAPTESVDRCHAVVWQGDRTERIIRVLGRSSTSAPPAAEVDLLSELAGELAELLAID